MAGLYLRMYGQVVDRTRLTIAEDDVVCFPLRAGRQVFGDPRTAPPRLAGISWRKTGTILDYTDSGLMIEAAGDGLVCVNGDQVNGKAALVPSDAFEVAGTLFFVHEGPPPPHSLDVANWLAKLESTERDQRWTAAQMLGTLAWHREDVRTALGKAAADPDARVANWANWALETPPKEAFFLKFLDAHFSKVPAITIPPGSHVLGRAPFPLTDISIPHMTLSRRSVRIDNTEQGWSLTDLKSMAGTYLNGHRVDPLQPAVLRDGDRFRVCAVTFRVCRRPDEP